MEQTITEKKSKQQSDPHKLQLNHPKQPNNQGQQKSIEKISPQKQEIRWQMQQKDINLREGEPDNDPEQYTKRSDQSQFRDWEITTVKSGKFHFNQKKQLTNNSTSLHQHHKKVQSQPLQNDGPKKSLKINKTLGAHKRQIKQYFGQILTQVLTGNKLIKTIFAHFCKENNLTSIKSSLFQDKLKIMEEMNLNKWMVFCKQFQIHAKLCKLKATARQQPSSQHIPLETSQIRELQNIKDAKQVQKRLMTIFRHANRNASKMNYQSFVDAVAEIYREFNPLYAQQQSGISDFLSEVMYCSQQKSCFKKLSQLKFTFATPQIEYNKVSFPSGQLRSRVKSRLILSKSKENLIQDIVKTNLTFSKPKMTKNLTELNLNPVLSEAKKSVKNMSIYSKKGQDMYRSIPKIRLKDLPNPKQRQKQRQMIEYFQSTKDAILQSYFVMEKVIKHSPDAKQ